MIPYGRQDVTDDDIAAVVSVLRSDFLTHGQCVPAFEAALTTQCGAKHAVAMANATAALHVGCLALELGEGDRLWTSPNSFVASANCGLYCGATVDFVDIDPRTYNMSVEALAAKLIQAERDGTLPKVVVPVHFGGQSCDMRGIKALGERYGFRIVEDASHAIGGRYGDEPVGCCQYSDIAVFSFHPVKIVTTGEGGAALTNDPELAARMMRLRTHGITRDSRAMEGESHGPWYYQMIEVGLNYRLTDMQAALGLSQMSRLERYVARRVELADRYDHLLAGRGLGLPWRDPACRSAWHLYVIAWNETGSNLARRDAFERLRAAGIGVNVHYIPVHLQPVYRALGFAEGDFPNAERYYQSAITLPLFPRLTDVEQDRVASELSSMTSS